MIEIAPKFLLETLDWINKTKPTPNRVSLLISNTQFSSKSNHGNMFVLVNIVNNIIQLYDPIKIQAFLMLNDEETKRLAIYYLMIGYTFFYGEEKKTLSTEQRIELATKWCDDFLCDDFYTGLKK